MRVAPRLAVLLTALPAPLLAGCLSYYLVGASPHQGVPPGSDHYKVGQCIRASDKAPVEGPAGKVYYVVTGQAGVALLELDQGTFGGNEIQNHWSDATADHFFTYTRGGGPAWHYVIPADRSKPGERRTFEKGKYTVAMVEGRFRPTGDPDSTCELIPQGL